MLKPFHRLRQRQLIQRVQRHGLVTRSQHLKLRSLGGQTGSPKLAVVVSTKVAKKATSRNRIRRRLRGALKDMEPQLVRGMHTVITVTDAGIDKLPFTKLEAELTSCLQDNGALH